MVPELSTAPGRLLILTALTGLVYPGVVTVLSHGLFEEKANGSLILRYGKVVGSELIGQSFTRPEYFHPRPSAAGEQGYDAGNSGGSNLGPTSARLADRVKAAVETFRRENPGLQEPIPSDLVTSSGSGMDPDLSPASAAAQVPRIAGARGVASDQIRSLVAAHTQHRDLGLLGEPRVNVLELNLAMDRQFPRR